MIPFLTSSLGIDLYLWIAYRTATMRTAKKTPWEKLWAQFGGTDGGGRTDKAIHRFRSRTLEELTKLKVAWPELDYELVRGAIVIRPSVSRIRPQRIDGKPRENPRKD